jgi:methylenetetrahydrofolate reductase (NADPH)
MIVDRIQREHKLTAMAHLTCVNATQEEIREVVEQIRTLGIKNILALRGDPPGSGGQFIKPEGGFEYSYQLVRFIRQLDSFCIGVAGFPEGHIACKGGREEDWKHLKEKVEHGAEFVLTQLFFDNADFFAFRDHLTKKLNVTVPVCPGIIPILSSAQIKRFTTMCGAHLPKVVLSRLEELGDDDQAVTEFGIEYASRQCAELLRAGAPGIHFYTLNKAYATARIVQNLGLSSQK